MTKTINPQEFQVSIDKSEIRTQVRPEDVTEQDIARLAKYNVLSAGDTIVVKCYDHDMTELYGMAEFIVTSRKQERKRQQIDVVNIKEWDDISYTVECKGDWWISAAHKEKLLKDFQETEINSPEPSLPKIDISGYSENPILNKNTGWVREWDKIARVHRVMVDGECVFSHKDKDYVNAIVTAKVIPPEGGEEVA